MASMTDPAGTITRMVLDGRGNVTSETAADGTPVAQTATRVYDSLNRVTSTVNGESEASLYTYDAAGNLLTAIDATGITSATTYDAKGRIATLVDASSGTTNSQYDLNDNITKVTATDGIATTIAYDAVNRVTQTTDALGIVRRVAYDTRDNIIAITDGRGSTTTFAYDALDRQISRTNPAGNVWRFEYDARDLREAAIKPDGTRIRILNDARGRMTTAFGTDVGATSRTFTYDATGNIIVASGSSGYLGFDYDERSLLTAILRESNGYGDRYRVFYSYDALGRRIAMNDNASASTLYAYDRANRLTAVTAPSGKVVNLDYDDAGRRTAVRFPNGLTTSAAFETPVAGSTANSGRLKSIAHGLIAGGGSGSALNLKLGTFNYGYDVKGNITGITETGTSPGSLPRTRAYSLDAVERLTKVTDAANSNLETYTLDAEGNRITSHKSSYHVTDAANRLNEDQTHAFEYDVNGNMVRKTVKASGETWRYSYTVFDELARASRRASADPAAPELLWKAYFYDGFGRLSLETGSAGPVDTTVLYHDGEHIIAEAKDNGTGLGSDGVNITNWYTHSDATDDLLAITPQAASGVPTPGIQGFTTPSQTQHYSVHTDHQGSVRAITDLTGQIVNAYAYDAYGNAEAAVESLTQRFRYTGREYDGVTRLYHYRARAYDAETGRFLQEDPLGFEASKPQTRRTIDIIDRLSENLASNPSFAARTNAFLDESGNTVEPSIKQRLLVPA
jgi:RHS repeat-associated protein